ncbi:unnamed protein product, partial [Anisakis simplex]|uniref:Uncharacterized protein n=1 Tax=Anisakis simplex TaxID=6269 RepID=A0A0M3JG98_ANISI
MITAKGDEGSVRTPSCDSQVSSAFSTTESARTPVFDSPA